ncbi:unnamed protein product (macronuclear) [Paramecium tetraurelia]|uniref:Uncharacterized protein n=1 Tax=Paramecium tetraurelia TaxID=5888 RepID=A0CQN2_PARTE|nr:uncharacterized protein GSPATT00009447001 [Paramecium tetraurelia]CAK73099.1 unnamed protein product [Paramecium tetraurelia]|eukprot:XP_001440496.1 hypothetical protein (macronuclear) [Paramecium tetraurelia strain d4-2]
MQINGRLQFDLKLDDKDYKISGNIFLKDNLSTDVEKEAETIANRIVEKVRQKSLNKSINKSVQNKYESQSATKFSQTEHFKSVEQCNSRQETLKNDYKQPYVSEYQSEHRSSLNFNNENQQLDICELITPQKHKIRHTKSQQCIKKDQPINKQSTIQLAESQIIIENNSNSKTKNGKHIIQLIDNAHNLIRKNSQILNKVQLQSPLKSSINTKSSLSIKSSINASSNKKKEDIVTQLLGSLRNAKKIKDEYQKRFF